MIKPFIVQLYVFFIIQSGFAEDSKESETNGINRRSYLNPGLADSEILNKIKTKNVTLRGPLPDSVNWVERGFDTPVLDQGRCGSCYAFASAAAIEAQYFIKYGEKIKLSEQSIVDCTKFRPNNGCYGGDQGTVFYYAEVKGIIQDADYAYSYGEGEYPYCLVKTDKERVKIDAFYTVRKNNEEELKKAVATYGPVTIGVDADHGSFQKYRGGVYYEPYCSSSRISHAMLVVGYGTTSDGKDYWLIKNSWGRKWGEKGYMKLARNRNNHCGIVFQAIYPVGVSKLNEVKHNNNPTTEKPVDKPSIRNIYYYPPTRSPYNYFPSPRRPYKYPPTRSPYNYLPSPRRPYSYPPKDYGVWNQNSLFPANNIEKLDINDIYDKFKSFISWN